MSIGVQLQFTHMYWLTTGQTSLVGSPSYVHKRPGFKLIPIKIFHTLTTPKISQYVNNFVKISVKW